MNTKKNKLENERNDATSYNHLYIIAIVCSTLDCHVALRTSSSTLIFANATDHDLLRHVFVHWHSLFRFLCSVGSLLDFD